MERRIAIIFEIDEDDYLDKFNDGKPEWITQFEEGYADNKCIKACEEFAHKIGGHSVSVTMHKF